MPYINRERRWLLTGHALQAAKEAGSLGELNFVITKLLLCYLDKLRLEEGAGPYATLSSVRAVLCDVADEYYRRVMVPYEEAKKEENGDVF